MQWTLKDGSKVEVKNLTTPHLINILRMFKRNALVEQRKDNNSYVWKEYVEQKDLFYELLREIESRDVADWEFLERFCEEVNIKRDDLITLINSCLLDVIKYHGCIDYRLINATTKKIVGIIKYHNKKVAQFFI